MIQKIFYLFIFFNLTNLCYSQSTDSLFSFPDWEMKLDNNELKSISIVPLNFSKVSKDTLARYILPRSGFKLEFEVHNDTLIIDEYQGSNYIRFFVFVNNKLIYREDMSED